MDYSGYCLVNVCFFHIRLQKGHTHCNCYKRLGFFRLEIIHPFPLAVKNRWPDCPIHAHISFYNF